MPVPSARLRAFAGPTKEELGRYDAQVLAFLVERLERMGEAAGGLYRYYMHRIEKRQGLLSYERFLMRYLAGERGPVFHAGIGIGFLTAGLARRGVQCIGWESDERRFAAARDARAVLAPGAAYDLRHANFPDSFRLGDRVAQATLLFTNVIATWSDEQVAGMIDAMRYFGDTILDLRLFGIQRDTPEAREELAQRFRTAGFRVRPIDSGLANVFYVSLVPRGFRPRATMRVRARELRLSLRRRVGGARVGTAARSG